MLCATDIQKYNSLSQEERVYIFLDGLDDRLNHIQSDVLQLKPFPTIEQASGVETLTIDVIMTTKGSNYGQQPEVTGKHNFSSKSKGPSTGSKCTHCENAKHTHDTYFKLHGYSEWWHELQARIKKDPTTLEDNAGKAVVATTEPHLSLIPLTDPSTSVDQGNCDRVFHNSTS